MHVLMKQCATTAHTMTIMFLSNPFMLLLLQIVVGRDQSYQCSSTCTQAIVTETFSSPSFHIQILSSRLLVVHNVFQSTYVSPCPKSYPQHYFRSSKWRTRFGTFAMITRSVLYIFRPLSMLKHQKYWCQSGKVIIISKCETTGPHKAQNICKNRW